jgi:hypothetical protein
MNTTLSNLEDLQNQIIAMVKTVKTGTSDEWRCSIPDENVLGVMRDASAFYTYPAVMVLFGDEVLKSITAMRDKWDGEILLTLLVYVSRDEMEAVVHDLKRLLASISRSKVNDATNPWIFQTAEKTTQGIHAERNYIEGIDLCVVKLYVVTLMRGQKVTF